jgi:NAD(P)-dependent dehydrogenase (short-subunit alcohol dehydrogenase family)
MAAAPAASRVAIVTGVSRGLGAALAAECLARGWRVLGIGRASAPLLHGPAYSFAACDLADVASLERAVAPVLDGLAASRPTHAVLVNNAATAGPVGVFGTLGAADIAASLATNLAAPAALASLFCAAFTDPACDRRIVNVSSGAAERAIAGGGLYCAAKAGLEMLTRAIVADHPDGTLVAVTLRPGVIDTGMQVFLRTQTAQALPSAGMFRDFHARGQLVAAAEVARKAVDRLLEGPVERGRTYSYAEL